MIQAQPQIKALPSKFNGVTFRSRLEARVAVFLTHIGARWEYEYEGFDLPSGYYLPDFWLPDVLARESRGLRGAWLEVKPLYDPTGVYQDALYELSYRTGGIGYLFSGDIRGLDYHGRGHQTPSHNLIETGFIRIEWGNQHEEQLAQAARDEDKLNIEWLSSVKANGGYDVWDNCMAFQSNGRDVHVEFSGGSYEWGNPAITAAAVEKALSWRFE
jgi:hypothetical protein